MKNFTLDDPSFIQLYTDRVDRAPYATVDGQVLRNDVALDLCSLADHDV